VALADPDLADCLARLSAGDQAAARAIYERFVDRLVRLAGRRLDRRLGAAADPESVAQSVFAAFFAGHRGGAFALDNWGMVYGLLAHITFRKCLNRNRDRRRGGRGGAAGPVAFADWQATSAAPGPAEAADVADRLAAVLARFDPDQRAALAAVLDGAAPDAVAARFGLSTRTVQRLVRRFRDRLVAELTAPDPAPGAP
jgi:DNA-directed RNA polymerase specialized sigma24 family protein